MSKLVDRVNDYCSSEYFLFLDPDLKENAEPLLSSWCRSVGEDFSSGNIEKALKAVAHLDVPLKDRKAFPVVLKAFLHYLSSTGAFAEAESCSRTVSRVEKKYVDSFREDGTVRGETVRNKGAAVGPNEPCPCGSGRKFKKCCMG